jgi:anti-sigma factor RsiW
MAETVEDITCRELVELVTAYLEGALPGGERARFEDHLRICEGCVTYVEQMRLTIAASGRIEEDDIEPPARDALLTAFRDWNLGRGA